MPALNRRRSPERWRLDAAGRAAAEALRGVLPPGAYTVASSEYKAVQTAVTIAGYAKVDSRLDEVHRPGDWCDDHRERACVYLGGTRHPGWEGQPDVVARWEAAISEHAKAADGDPLVMVGHGMAMTLWLASHLPIDPVAFWSELAFPDVWQVDLTARSTTHLLQPAA